MRTQDRWFSWWSWLIVFMGVWVIGQIVDMHQLEQPIYPSERKVALLKCVWVVALCFYRLEVKRQLLRGKSAYPKP